MVLAGAVIAPAERRSRQRNLKRKGKQEELLCMGTFGLRSMLTLSRHGSCRADKLTARKAKTTATSHDRNLQSGGYNSGVAAGFQFDHIVGFAPEEAEAILRFVPALPGVFALCGPRDEDEPYLTRTADLRRRMRRLLNPPESQSKRLNLRDKVARIEYCVTGSEFESSLVLYRAAATLFGYVEARRRLKLHTPYFLRMTTENAFPRVYSTNKLSKRGLAQMYGPFPSRLAAERSCDALLDLFKLSRCYEDLAPYPAHPGCVYGEMEECLEP